MSQLNKHMKLSDLTIGDRIRVKMYGGEKIIEIGYIDGSTNLLNGTDTYGTYITVHTKDIISILKYTEEPIEQPCKPEIEQMIEKLELYQKYRRGVIDFDDMKMTTTEIGQCIDFVIQYYREN